jgi:hypothetical protein
MTLMVTGAYQPASQCRMNEIPGEHFPAHVIGDPHDGHEARTAPNIAM